MGGIWKNQTVYAVYKGDKFLDEGTRNSLIATAIDKIKVK